MRRSSLGLAMMLAVFMTMVFPAVAAELHEPHEGTDAMCASDEDGMWHFVNNQTNGATSGYIVVEFAGTTVSQDADKILRNTMHFTVVGPDELITATTYTDAGMSTQVDGKLVLSDYACEKKAKK